MTSRRKSSITFYLDRCLGGKIIAETLKQAGITVEIHDKHFAQNAQDVDWLPEVGKREWVVLTKDANIRKNQLERIAVASANIKMFIFTVRQYIVFNYKIGDRTIKSVIELNSIQFFQ